jgi:hypothetical protein
MIRASSVDVTTLPAPDIAPVSSPAPLPQVLGAPVPSPAESALGRFEPATLGQQAVHQRALDTFDRAVELRRLRLEAVQGRLSIPMWVFVLGGGGLAIAASFFFKVADWRLHAVMVGLLATFIAMVVVLITALDPPFVGDLGITPDAFRLVLASYGPSRPSVLTGQARAA